MPPQAAIENSQYKIMSWLSFFSSKLIFEKHLSRYIQLHVLGTKVDKVRSPQEQVSTMADQVHRAALQGIPIMETFCFVLFFLILFLVLFLF